MVALTFASTIQAAASDVRPQTNDPQPNMSRPGWAWLRKALATSKQTHREASQVNSTFSATIAAWDS